MHRHFELSHSFSWFHYPHCQSFCLFSCAFISLLVRKKYVDIIANFFILCHDRTITSIFKFQTFCDSHFIYTLQSFVLSPVFAWSESMFHIFCSFVWIRINKNENEPWNLYSLHITSISISIRKKTHTWSLIYSLAHSLHSVNQQYWVKVLCMDVLLST